jgi:UDP-glucose 4-epimerase
MASSKFRPKRLVVTGGRGRLAALIAAHFRALGHTVQLYSRTGGGGFHPLDELTATPALKEADILLHLAWSTLPATAEQHPGAEQREDLPRLEQLLTKLGTLAVNQRPNFVFFSSGGAIYGNAPGRPSLETDLCRPIGRYGRSKLGGEELINQAVASHGLPCTILRIANPYGYSVSAARPQGVIPHAISCALEGRPLTLWGNGEARKDFIHHTDFLSALGEIISRCLLGTFNLGSGESHSVREIIELVEKHTGRKVFTEASPAPAWDVHDSRLDVGRLRAATGWSPQVPLDEGIRRATAAFRDQLP